MQVPAPPLVGWQVIKEGKAMYDGNGAFIPVSCTVMLALIGLAVVLLLVVVL